MEKHVLRKVDWLNAFDWLKVELITLFPLLTFYI